MPPIPPRGAVDTIFLDVGNTLISIDFAWVAAELSERGVRSTAGQVQRAEAAARPGYSRRLFVDGVPPGTDLFAAYLAAILEALPATAAPGPPRRDQIVAELRGVLRPDGRASTLWRTVMPGVPAALARLRALGLQLVVVSNSDGTVEQSLASAGLREHLSHVVDSAIAGYEKPDPRIFHHALRQCGADAARTLHIGDLFHADVLGARAAGLHALLLDPFGDWTEVDCPVAADLGEVAEAMAGGRS